MSSFNGNDYDLLFTLGQVLYSDPRVPVRRAIAMTLMAMAENIRGQQMNWPGGRFYKTFEPLTQYSGAENLAKQYREILGIELKLPSFVERYGRCPRC